MSNETKRDVFEDALRALEEFGEQGSSWEMAYDDLSSRYSVASDDTLPDDLPVIPKAVGEYLKSNRTEPLGKVFWHLGCISVALLGSTRSYIVDHTEDFARAWVLGVWRVEETGEIVKLNEKQKNCPYCNKPSDRRRL